MPLEFETPEGATPLEPEELEQLIPSHITTMAQLNEAEQLNIAAASLWAHSRRRSNVLTTVFAQLLHKRMFDDVWRWAGEFRHRAANIGGVEAYEIAVRLHHGLTVTHAFPNGNGRHARLMTDVFLRNIDCAPFSWGSGADLAHQGDLRIRYIGALQAADNHDIRPLMNFARS